MANVNATVLRLESGATIIITPTLPTGSAMTVLNLHPGTVKFTVPKRDPHPFTDRGVQQQPLDGDDRLGDLEFDVKAGAVGASELVPVLTANGQTTGTPGRVALFDVVIKIPNYRGASAGMQRTFTSFFLTDSPSYQSGADFDVYKLKGQFLTYAEATY